MFRIEDSFAVVVDVQVKLAAVMHNKDPLVQQLVRLVTALNALSVPIVCTEQLPDKLGPTVPDIAATIQAYAPIKKSTFSCCGEPGFVTACDALDRKNIILCGIETHVCVFQTAVDLMNRGFHVQVIADATSSRTPSNRDIGLARMSHAGADISSVESTVFELMGDAQHTAFKAVLAAIK